MSDTPAVRRRTRDRQDEYQFLMSVPRMIDSRAEAYRQIAHPNLSQVAFWNEAMIFYLDSHNAAFPEAKK
jgi:hypothetical protein